VHKGQVELELAGGREGCEDVSGGGLEQYGIERAEALAEQGPDLVGGHGDAEVTVESSDGAFAKPDEAESRIRDVEG